MPSHKVGQILKKFFWKKYPVPNGTRLVFSTSILLNYPATFGGELEAKASEVVNDKSRIYEFTKEELRIWLEVLKLRYGEDRYNKVVEALGLSKLPTYQKVMGYGLIFEQNTKPNPDKQNTSDRQSTITELNNNTANKQDITYRDFLEYFS
jgi:hypothetical protein